MMSKPYSLPETSIGTSDHDPRTLAQRWLARWLCRLQGSVAKLEQAHALRCELASLPPNVLSDTGSSPEDASGIASHQPDLPFF